MPIFTYFTEIELEKYKQVTNETINELFQEVRQFDNRLHIKEIAYPVEKHFFRPDSPAETRYNIYCVNGCEAQILNFPVPHTDTKFRNGYCAAQTITYLFGLLNGHDKKQEL